MKQPVFDFIKIRLRILGINIVNTFNLETAYPAENWANALSTIAYTISYLLFLNIIFGNVSEIAGYSKNDMYFFSLIGQAAFYSLYTWSYDNMEALIESVRLGELDVLLTKPVPTLFYISTRKISIVRVLRDALVPLILIATLIDWTALSLTFNDIIIGTIVFICGQWAAHTIQFLLSITVFWNGQSKALLGISYTITDPGIPLEGIIKMWRVIFITILPICLSVAGSVSVMLGKSNPTTMLFISLTVAILSTVLRQKMWVRALNIYNSASS